MGLDLVPETVLADGPFGPGSAQRFVEEDFEFDPRPLFFPKLDGSLWPMAVLDLVCNNADRKIGHLIRDKATDRLWAIDHGLTFHAEPKLRTVLWGFAGQQIPWPLVEGLTGLRSSLSEASRSGCRACCRRRKRSLSPIGSTSCWPPPSIPCPPSSAGGSVAGVLVDPGIGPHPSAAIRSRI